VSWSSLWRMCMISTCSGTNTRSQLNATLHMLCAAFEEQHLAASNAWKAG
jgi:hypothetical protein